VRAPPSLLFPLAHSCPVLLQSDEHCLRPSSGPSLARVPILETAGLPAPPTTAGRESESKVNVVGLSNRFLLDGPSPCPHVLELFPFLHSFQNIVSASLGNFSIALFEHCEAVTPLLPDPIQPGPCPRYILFATVRLRTIPFRIQDASHTRLFIDTERGRARGVAMITQTLRGAIAFMCSCVGPVPRIQSASARQTPNGVN
jgi:hypothetical protein